MFRFWRRFAFRRAKSPRARALAALARRDYATAERELGALLEAAESALGAAAARERAFLHNKRGVARIGCHRLGDARADFDAALRWVANYPPALTNRGNLLLDEGRVDDAIASYRAAILADPDYAIAHLNLGVAYKRAGRIEEGVRELRLSQRLERANFLRRRRPS